MIHHERMHLNALRLCSLGQLVVIRKQCLRTDYVPVIDCAIYSQIRNVHLLFEKKQPKRLVKNRRRGMISNDKYQRECAVKCFEP